MTSVLCYGLVLGGFMLARVVRHPRIQSEAGFTLIELMTAVAVIGILAVAAAQHYSEMTGRARRSEAVSALGNVLKVQRARFSESNTFGDTFPALGLELEGATAVTSTLYVSQAYAYSLTTAGNSWITTAIGNIDSDQNPGDDDRLAVSHDWPGNSCQMSHGIYVIRDDLRDAAVADPCA